MATHSSILAWRVPWTEEPGRLQGHKGSDITEVTDHTRTSTHPKTKKGPVQNVSGAKAEKSSAGVRVDHVCAGQESRSLNFPCLMELSVIMQMFGTCVVQYISRETHEVI